MSAAKRIVAQNAMVQADYQLRYYLHLEPDSLSDTEWAIAIRALEKIRKEESITHVK